MSILDTVKMKKTVKKVNKLAPFFEKMTDDELKTYSLSLKEKVSQNHGKNLDAILPEAFALAREASARVLHKRHYDVQVMGGYVLNTGNVAEMSTGSGKATPVDLKIPTPSGFRKCGDIRVGDFILNRLGEKTLVTGVFPQGEVDTYLVTLSDGREIPCAKTHLWTVSYVENGEKVFKTIPTEEMLGKKNDFYWIPNNGPVRYSRKYQRVEAIQYGKMLVFSKNKDLFLEDAYLYGSLSQRRSLLVGMVLASVQLYPPKKNRKYQPRISLSSQTAAEQTMSVIRSLGMNTSMFPVVKENGEVRYLVSFRDPIAYVYKFLGERIRKLCGFSLREGNSSTPFSKVRIHSVQKLEKKTEQVCFTVDNPEHLYLVGDYVVTHNTLTEVLPAYLNALTGEGVHIITVNDYLAKRDMEEMGKVFQFLGLTVSWIHSELSTPEKKKAYMADIVYGTNNEFGFDYLRDNMVKNKEDRVQRKLNYCIIDEVDSILIDEARTPLIISQNTEDDDAVYKMADDAVKDLERGENEEELTQLEKLEKEKTPETEEEIDRKKDFQVNEKYQTITLTDRGVQKLEKKCGISSPQERVANGCLVKNLGSVENSVLYHHLLQAIRARFLMKKNVDYIVADGEVLIIDASTGRTMQGRRFSDGLHQALEAKEGVAIQGENETAATITLQNYFRLYNKISGMTGTAKTEEKEFRDIYGMKVCQIPDNKPCIREDRKDIVYYSKEEKEEAIYEMTKKAHEKGQPVLIGTPSIEASESLSRLFTKKGLPHNLLNAKSTYNQDVSSATKEAMIIAQAGQSGKVTISTNMAGRGTDILLGGNPEYLAVSDMLKIGCPEEMVYQAQNFTVPENPIVLDAQTAYQFCLKKEKEICEKDRKKVQQAGGLLVIGSERHESRRIDNQLRGRAGRQGEEGASQFVLSLDDKLFSVYGGSMTERLKKMLAGQKKGEPLYQGGMMERTIVRSQKNIESQNFQQRKNVLEYDEIDNVQREEVYGLRNRILDGKNVEDDFSRFVSVGKKELLRIAEDGELSNSEFSEFFENDGNMKNMKERVAEKLVQLHDGLLSIGISDDTFREIKVQSLLMALDKKWKGQLIAMQNLKETSRLTNLGNVQPIEVYKKEAGVLWDAFKVAVGRELLYLLFSMRVVLQEEE